MITGLADCWLHVIFFATAISSFLYRIIVATTSLHQHHTTACMRQPHYYHIYRISFPNCPET